MLLSKKLENLGDIKGTIYDFEKVGDILPKHNHTEDSVHITIVARGKIKAYSHDWELEAMPGQILDFRPNEPHEIMALEDNTRIFNIIKKYGGTPNDYAPVVQTDVEYVPPTIEITQF
jgi:quercetin dioxygenase-like cupin family protein